MELKVETIEFLKRLIKVAKILKIDSVVLDNECVRGHFQQEGSMIIERDNKPVFEFKNLGISRITILNSRLALVDDKDLSIDAEEKQKDNTEILINKLILGNAKTQVEFRCADPAHIKAPKLLKDPVFYTFIINEDSISLLAKANSAVKGECVTFNGSKKSGVSAKMSDVEGDSMVHVITDVLSFSSECDKDKMAFSYKNQVLIPVLNAALDNNSELSINITRRGILNIQLFGINVYISPEVQ